MNNSFKKYNYIGLKYDSDNSEVKYAISMEEFEKTYFYSNLIEQQIYLSNPSRFNDKEEFYTTIDILEVAKLYYDDVNYNIFKERHKKNKSIDKCIKKLKSDLYIFGTPSYKSLKEIYKEFKKNVNDTMNNIKGNIGVFCLAPFHDIDKFWDSKTDYYIKDYNGVCCEYEFNNDFFSYNNLEADYVSYNNEKEIHSLNFINFEKNHKDSRITTIFKNKGFYFNEQERTNMLKRSLFRKDEIWKNENEYRILKTIFIENERFVKLIPSKIYIGCNVIPEIREWIKNYCEKNNILCEVFP